MSNPVIGLGAPVRYFLPEAARLLNVETIIPQHADVANAIGAVTSQVMISKQVHIRPNELGEYAVAGLADARSFSSFDDAHNHAMQELQRNVVSLARDAGTSESRIQVHIDDKISRSAEGMEIFLERAIKAQLRGVPDIARLA
jgi:hypothetical protein